MPVGNIGISSFSYPIAVRSGMEPQKLLERALRLNVPVVQLADNIRLEQRPDKELDSLASFAKEHGLQLETGFRGLSREKLTRYLDVNRRLSSRLLRIVTHSPEDDPSLEEVCDILSEFSHVLEREDICLGLETHDRFTAPQYAQIMRQTASGRIGIVLDPVNCLSNEEKPLDVAKTLAEYTLCCHVKDYTIQRRRTGSGLEMIGTILGQGRADIPSYLNIVEQHSPFRYNVILEFWAESFEATEETLSREQRQIEECLSYLKSCLQNK